MLTTSKGRKKEHPYAVVAALCGLKWKGLLWEFGQIRFSGVDSVQTDSLTRAKQGHGNLTSFGISEKNFYVSCKNIDLQQYVGGGTEHKQQLLHKVYHHHQINISWCHSQSLSQLSSEGGVIPIISWKSLATLDTVFFFLLESGSPWEDLMLTQGIHSPSCEVAG